MTRPEANTEPPLDLDDHARVLLDRSAAAQDQMQACESLYRSCLDRLPALSDEAMQLPSGQALSPVDAARCLLDFLRTARFLQAVDQAIETRSEQAPGRPIELLYAGCGPLAPLVLPLARRHRSRGLRITLIDAHESSLHHARRLFGLAGISDLLHDCVCADATRMRLDPGRRPDILVAEVMQRALSREPQLAIVANLFPQCAADAVLVPRCVSVSAWMARMGAEPSCEVAPERISLGPLLELSIATLPNLLRCLHEDPEALPEQCLALPHTLPQGLSVMLRTRIEAGEDLRLGDYDSGLTYPQFLWNLDGLAAGSRLGFTYRMGGYPGFVVRRLEAGESRNVRRWPQ